MKNHLIPLLLFILFSACVDAKTGKSDSLEIQEESSPELNSAEKFEAFIKPLKEVELPLTIEIDEDNLDGVQLTEQQIKDFSPYDCDKPVCRAFAQAKIKVEDLTGVFYLYSYTPVDLDDHEELAFEIYLGLYDETGTLVDDLLLAIQDYGNGKAYIKSWDECIYFFKAEMEFITLIVHTYVLEGRKFNRINREEKTFDSSERGYEAYLDYVNTLTK
jgi:hypothetical protein